MLRTLVFWQLVAESVLMGLSKNSVRSFVSRRSSRAEGKQRMQELEEDDMVAYISRCSSDVETESDHNNINQPTIIAPQPCADARSNPPPSRAPQNHQQQQEELTEVESLYPTTATPPTLTNTDVPFNNRFS